MDRKPCRTVRDLVDHYRRRRANEHNLKPRTVGEYERQLLALIEHCGDVSLDEFDVEHVHEYLGACARGSLPSRYSVLAAMLRWADKRGVVEGIADLVPERRPVRRWRTRYLSSAEFVQIWTWIDERETRPKARRVTLDAIRLALICPLRRGEIVSLAPHEVDIEGSRLNLHDTKSGNRTVPLSPMGRAICRRRLMAGGEYLFPARNRRGHMLAESLSHAWQRICRACGIHGATLHGTRHTWASHAIQNGVSLEYVRRIMGHSTEWMSVKYAHVSCEQLQSAADRVEFVLLPGGCDDA